MSGVFIKTYEHVPLSEREILRYAGVRAADASLLSLLESCIEEARGAFSYKLCYCLAKVIIKDGVCDFGVFSVKSNDLAKNLAGCERVIIFAATAGIGIDRLISKYSKLSPSRALLLQSIGAEGIEALCDGFCTDIKEKYSVKLRPRFSAGYGDLPIETQKDIFKILDAPKKIGLSLTNSMLMSPTKSVTAFIGMERL